MRPRRPLPRLVGGAALLVGAAFALPCAAQFVPRDNVSRIASVDAATLYNGACAACHGQDGTGDGPAARRLGEPRPRNLTAGVFKFRSTPSGSLPTDDDLFRTISRGVPGTWMPQWSELLAPEEIWALVDYVKGFSPLFALEEPEAPIDVPRPPPVTPDLIEEGMLVYTMLGCAACHGERGQGDGPSSRELTDDDARPIKAYDFTRGYYKNGWTSTEVYTTLVTGLSGTPMPAFQQESLAFPGGTSPDLLPPASGPASYEELRTYLAPRPSANDLQRLSAAQLTDLTRHRMWALVAYVESLARPKNALDWLFRDNPELSGGRLGR